MQGMQNSQNNLEKEECFQNLPQSYSNQDRMVLA